MNRCLEAMFLQNLAKELVFAWLFICLTFPVFIPLPSVILTQPLDINIIFPGTKLALITHVPIALVNRSAWTATAHTFSLKLRKKCQRWIKCVSGERAPGTKQHKEITDWLWERSPVVILAVWCNIGRRGSKNGDRCCHKKLKLTWGGELARLGWRKQWKLCVRYWCQKKMPERFCPSTHLR